MTEVARLAFPLAFAALLGCNPGAPPAPGTSSSATSSAASTAVAAGVPITGASTAPAIPAVPGDAGIVEHPKVCEVEIGGQVKSPRKLVGAAVPVTFVAVGDCLGDGTIVGTGGTTSGRLFIEVFVPWGSDLTLCAASEPAPGKPSTLYGKAKVPMHAEKGGEVEFHDVVVELAPGPPKTFARPVR